MKRTLASFFVGLIGVSILTPSFSSVSAAKKQAISKTYQAMAINQHYDALVWEDIANELFSSFTKNWYHLQVKELNNFYSWKLDLSDFKDLTLTNDVVFDANKKALENINQKQIELSSKIDVILEKINTKEESIDNVDSKYKRYIEIENDVNSSEYVYVLAMPVNKFLLKETELGSNNWSIIITREPTIWAWTDTTALDTQNVDTELKAIIEKEISEIREQPSVNMMKEKIVFFSEKHNRNYSPLFIEKSFEQFFKDISVNISNKDKKFDQGYTYRNKEYMNSFYYLPQKLKKLADKTNEYLFVYIPLKSSNPSVVNILQWVDSNNRTRVFRDSPDFCFKIDYTDNHQVFNKTFCSLNEYFTWGTIKVENIELHYYNNFFIKLSRLWFMSVILQLLILIAFALAPLLFVKYVDKIIGFGSKFETEQL